jgi:hypothetical protein
MITIQGLTELQRDLADQLWSLDTTEDIEQWMATLPKSLKREAWVVMNMIIWAELDQFMEVSDEVSDYLCGR